MKLKREIEYQNSHIFYSFSGSSGCEREKNVTIFFNKRAKYMYIDISNNFIVNFECRLRNHRTSCVPIFDKEKLNTSYWGRRRENGAIPSSSFFCEKMD